MPENKLLDSMLSQVVREVDPQIYRLAGQRTFYLAYEIHDPVEDHEYRKEIEFTPDDLTPRGVWMTTYTGVSGFPALDDQDLVEFYRGEDGLREFFRCAGLSGAAAMTVLERIIVGHSEFESLLRGGE